MVPPPLRRWFIVHFWADMLFAVPLFFAPELTLGLLGWPCVDPLATRLVAAALFGIGIESLLGRDASLDAFRQMLTLKVIWSGTATLGILWSQLAAPRAPLAGWGFLAIFAGFHVLWHTWRRRVVALVGPVGAGRPG